MTYSGFYFTLQFLSQFHPLSLFFFCRLYYTLLSPNENVGSSHTSNNGFLGVLFRSSYVRVNTTFDTWVVAKCEILENTLQFQEKKVKKVEQIP